MTASRTMMMLKKRKKKKGPGWFCLECLYFCDDWGWKLVHQFKYWSWLCSRAAIKTWSYWIAGSFKKVSMWNLKVLTLSQCQLWPQYQGGCFEFDKTLPGRRLFSSLSFTRLSSSTAWSFSLTCPYPHWGLSWTLLCLHYLYPPFCFRWAWWPCGKDNWPWHLSAAWW